MITTVCKKIETSINGIKNNNQMSSAWLVIFLPFSIIICLSRISGRWSEWYYGYFLSL